MIAASEVQDVGIFDNSQAVKDSGIERPDFNYRLFAKQARHKVYEKYRTNAHTARNESQKYVSRLARKTEYSKQIPWRATNNTDNYDPAKVYKQLFHPLEFLTDNDLGRMTFGYKIDEDIVAPIRERIDETIKDKDNMIATYRQFGEPLP